MKKLPKTASAINCIHFVPDGNKPRCNWYSRLIVDCCDATCVPWKRVPKKLDSEKQCQMKGK